MKAAVYSLLVAVLFAGQIYANAASNKGAEKRQVQSIIIVSPSELPELAQEGGEAMLLHSTSDGRVILYVEGIGGKDLATLDVTNPAEIRPIARVAISTPGVFDFVRTVNDTSVLIRYRGEWNGYAVLDLRKVAYPTIAPLPTNTHYRNADSAEMIGQSDLLLRSAAYTTPQPEPMPRDYAILDTANASHPVLLATVHGVKQQLFNGETGTLFLLSKSGITVVRRPAVEAEYAAVQLMMSKN